MSALEEIKNLPDIDFMNSLTLQELADRMIKNYEEKYKELTGKQSSLVPYGESYFVLHACALQLYQLFAIMDKNAKMNFLKYATGEQLDHLAAFKNIKRNPAQKATVQIQFLLAEPRQETTIIAQGVRVAADEIYFECIESKEIKPGEIETTVLMQCTQEGTAGNGMIVGSINTLVDPIPYIEEIKNEMISTGGAETENDDSLRERIYLAPSSYSVAGAKDAYIYHAKTCSQNVSDVCVFSNTPGTVNVCFLLDKGMLPSEADLNKMQKYLTDSTRKPLTDQVIVSLPDTESYNLIGTYWISKTKESREESIKKQVNEAIEGYISWQGGKIGMDLNPQELIRNIVNAGAKRVELLEPVFHRAGICSVAKIQQNSLIYGGLEDG